MAAAQRILPRTLFMELPNPTRPDAHRQPRTFLFTDIEGSTRLWEAQPETMNAAVARHDVLVRGAIERHRGEVFKTGGDSFCAAFASAENAVTAALGAQRALRREPWPPEITLRVRMALHTGEAERRQTGVHGKHADYFGPSLSRVARLMDAAHGEQVLLSQTVGALVRETLPSGADLRDLGAHRLKDLTQPEHIFQLLHPDLNATFPPVRSLDAQPNNLPPQLTSFVGREAEITGVLRHLGQTRLLTLTGPGGGGKTRLALQAAADLVGKRPDGVWLVELANRAEEAAVPQALAGAIGVREEPGRPLSETLSDYLRAKNLLLILDNCEHLIDACAALADGLLRAGPDVRILATSREPLGIPGEVVFPVPSLSLPPGQDHEAGSPDRDALMGFESVRLFVDRATASVPAFAVTPANAGALAELCRRLDGIPLAIELAAARVTVLTPVQIAARLQDRFRLLTGGARTVLPRHQTLRAAIDWSYDLLSPGEQTLLRRLSVFAGGWTLEAAEAVCSDDGRTATSDAEPLEEWEVLDRLGRLVDKSLVVVEQNAEPAERAELNGGQARYRLLEMIREYAEDRLHETDEESGLRARHRHWFLALAEQAEPAMRGAAQARWFDRLEREHDNLRVVLAGCMEEPGGAEAGLRLAGALSRLWYVRGHLAEGRRWLDALLAAGPDAAPSIRAKALHAAGSLARDQGDYARAETLYEQALALRRALGDAHGVAASLQQLGAVDFDRGRYDAAGARIAETLARFRASGYRRGVAISLNYQGMIAKNQGDTARAIALLEESLAESRAAGETWGEAMALGSLGHIAQQQGRGDRAAGLYAQSLARYRETGDKRGIALSLCRLGEAAQIRGELESATQLYCESLVQYQKVGDRLGMAACLGGLASIAVARDQLPRAARLFGAAQALREALGAPLPPAERDAYERDVAVLRARLTPEHLTREWEAGQALALEQAITCALEP